MFFDLNVRINKLRTQPSLKEEMLNQLTEYGYRAIAFLTEIDESVFDKPKKTKGSKKSSANDNESEETITDVIPLPYDTSSLTEKYPKIKFYKRLEIVISDTANIRKIMQSKNIKKYDLISIQPENQSVLKALSTATDFDIISYNPQCKCNLSFNRKIYSQFVSHNVYFEIKYAPAITDTSSRKNLISLSHIYHAVGKSKNIILTSGAELSTHIRGPYDVSNFALLFGLSEEQAKSAISRNCGKLLQSARARRRNKAAIEMKKVSPLNKSDTSMEVEVT